MLLALGLSVTLQDVISVSATIVAALGGGGLIVFGLSNWLGNVWASRLMAAETARNQRDIEALKALLQEKIDQSSQAYRHKLDLYREAARPMIDLLVEFEANGRITAASMQDFERKRLNTTALLGMFASDDVFDAYNGVIDYMYDAMEGKKAYSFHELRVIALKFLSAVRRDIGFHSTELTYRGTR